MKHEAKLLLEKACDALVQSIEIFNRPHDRGRVSSTLIQLDCIGWRGSNPNLPAEALQDAFRKLTRPDPPAARWTRRGLAGFQSADSLLFDQPNANLTISRGSRLRLAGGLRPLSPLRGPAPNSRS
jgi:hypothetical protein